MTPKLQFVGTTALVIGAVYVLGNLTQRDKPVPPTKDEQQEIGR